jgi:hypothetical protein
MLNVRSIAPCFWLLARWKDGSLVSWERWPRADTHRSEWLCPRRMLGLELLLRNGRGEVSEDSERDGPGSEGSRFNVGGAGASWVSECAARASGDGLIAPAAAGCQLIDLAGPSLAKDAAARGCVRVRCE